MDEGSGHFIYILTRGGESKIRRHDKWMISNKSVVEFLVSLQNNNIVYVDVTGIQFFNFLF